MKKMIIACGLMLTSVMPAYAEDYSPAQQIVITTEVWRLRAIDCRSRYNSFTGPEVEAITNLVINSTLAAKFDPNDLNDLMKAIGVSKYPTLNEELCGKLHTMIFGLP